MEVVIIYEYLSGAHGEEVIEEVSVFWKCPRKISVSAHIRHGRP